MIAPYLKHHYHRHDNTANETDNKKKEQVVLTHPHTIHRKSQASLKQSGETQRLTQMMRQSHTSCTHGQRVRRHRRRRVDSSPPAARRYTWCSCISPGETVARYGCDSSHTSLPSHSCPALPTHLRALR